MTTSFTLYTSNQVGNTHNVQYPHDHHITDPAGLKAAVNFDHVAAEYQGGRRSANSFIGSTCVVMDIDNDHTDRQLEWVTPQRLAELLPGVEFYTATSRNHMKPKGQQSSRPRFHVYFPTELETNPEAYVGVKKELAGRYNFFDPNATDAARFIYGNPDAQVEYFEGQQSISDWVQARDLFAEFDASTQLIGEGSRNATLSRFAGRVLIRYGNTDQARNLFDAKADLCRPPLPKDEVERIWASAIRFARKVEQDPDYLTPEQYEQLRSLRPSDMTDVGQALMLGSEYLGEMRYSPATDWLTFNGQYWEESAPAAQRVAQDLTARQLTEALTLKEEAAERMQETGATALIAAMSKQKAQGMFTPPQRQAFLAFEEAETYYKYVLKRRESKAITACLKEARPMLLIDPSQLDNQPQLINTPAGTINLAEGPLAPTPHDAGLLLTKMTTVAPSTDGTDIWQQALEVFFQGDSELIEYVQRIVGLAAFGYVRVEALIIAYGDGRNGKSTFWNTLARVLGSYSGNLSADVLTAGMRRNIKPELAEAKGKRLLIAAELEEGVRLSTSNVKHLASTDEIYAEKKYKAPFAFTPSHTLVLYTNHLPRVGAMDAGIWRRLIVIPFEAKIEGDSDIKNFAEYLYDKAGGAILSWIIEGARKIHADDYKLHPPAKVRDAQLDYKDTNDWLGRFIEECCDTGSHLTQPAGAFYEEYRAWCARTGEWARALSDFNSALESSGFTKTRSKAGRFWLGVALTSEFNA
ncbi:phage/plasmid primase, P4 family [Trueperella pyogenes]|uniref:phage/plasmid primase, P4 family n=1 Tax=Trueperella pyogenes TaxID=1661 RepID=UPI00345D0F8F